MGSQDHRAGVVDAGDELFHRETFGHGELRAGRPRNHFGLVARRGCRERRRKLKVLREQCGRKENRNRIQFHAESVSWRNLAMLQ